MWCMCALVLNSYKCERCGALVSNNSAPLDKMLYTLRVVTAYMCVCAYIYSQVLRQRTVCQ